jgi:hypothetical protein
LVEHTAENRGVAGSIPALAIGSRPPGAPFTGKPGFLRVPLAGSTKAARPAKPASLREAYGAGSLISMRRRLLHHVTGCAADGQGDIFFVDMWGTPGPPIPAGPGSAAFTGSVVELAPDGTATVLVRGLNFPNGIAVARDGSLYVTVDSTCSAQGSPFPYCAAGGGIVRLQR